MSDVVTTEADGAAASRGGPAPLPAGLRHDQRGAPLRLPLARLGLRPAGLPRPAGAGGRRPRRGPGDDRDSSKDEDGLELDLVTHDARKFFGLLLKKNGYVLEQLYSPLVVHTTPEHEELKAIARGCVTRHHSHHYFGFAETQWRLFEKERPRRVKPLLYVYRVLLTGIHLMRTGEVEANLVRLNEEARLGHVDDLIARKLAGPEQSALDDADLEFHRGESERLRAELEAAHTASSLPEVPSGRDALDELLVAIRVTDPGANSVRNWPCEAIPLRRRATCSGSCTGTCSTCSARSPRGLAPPDRLLGLVRQGHRLAPARRRPPQAVDPAGRLRPARCPDRLRARTRPSSPTSIA